MNTQELAYEKLKTKNYQQAATLYEELIENEPQSLTHYWYLGLVYLLQWQVEEAQGIWLSAMFEIATETPIEERSEQLAEVLKNQAQSEQKQGNLNNSQLIREQLQELLPEDINNRIQLVQLSAETGTLTLEQLEAWEITEVLEQTPQTTLSSQLVLEMLQSVLEQPFSGIQSFLKATFLHLDNANQFLEIVMQAALRVANQQLRFDIGVELIQTCYELKPNYLEALKYLSIFKTEQQEHDKAITKAKEYYQKSSHLVDQVTGTYLILRALQSAGAWLEISEYAKLHQQLLEQIIELQPQNLNQGQNEALLTSLFVLPYLQDYPQYHHQLSQQIAQIFSNNLPSLQLNKFLIQSTQGKHKLKLGYIGNTFRRHSVGWLSRWLLRHHDKNHFEVIVYLASAKEDELTRQIIEFADSVRYLQGTPQEKIETIQADDIDILVELDSISYTSTLELMARRIAPIQISWLGWDAVGTPNIDYFLADPYVLPKDAQNYYQETIWRLPNTYIAVKGFEVGVPTISRQQLDIPEDAIIYFSSQTGRKRNPHAVRLQMRILQQVPNSYFLLKGRSDDQLIQEFFFTIAEQEGVDASRLRFLPFAPHETIHRANLGIADVVLDTYPYNGATTTLETLWMGIPLVTRVGEQFAARNSYAFLKNAGVEEGIAWSDDEYVEWGIKFGTNENLRRDVHWKLLQSRKTAPLWNVEQFVTDMETAYQQMWEKYIEQVKTYPVAKETPETKPTLRLLHNLPRCGGTVISKCLATMNDNLLLSEIHPQGIERFNPLQQAHDWFHLFSQEELENFNNQQLSLIDAIDLIQQRSQEYDYNLIIRDWAHLDFFGIPWINYPSYRLGLAETLATDFHLKQIAILRHPIDQWLSLRRLAVLQGQLTLEGFLRGYLEFAKLAHQIGFIRYEDFTIHPDATLKHLCQQLDMTFDPEYRSKWSNYTKITGDITTNYTDSFNFKFNFYTNKQLDQELLEQLAHSQYYQDIIKLTQYSTPVPICNYWLFQK